MRINSALQSTNRSSFHVFQAHILQQEATCVTLTTSKLLMIQPSTLLKAPDIGTVRGPPCAGQGPEGYLTVLSRLISRAHTPDLALHV